LSAASSAPAEQVTYTIDPLQSSLTLLGNLTGTTAGQQTPGSLTTSFSGTIVANRTAGAIEFPGGSVLNAAVQATNQQPWTDGSPGSRPADYGRIAPGPFPDTTTLEALRNFELDVFDDTSGAGSTVGPTGQFASNSLQLQIDVGDSDVMVGNIPVEVDLSDKGTSNGNGNGASSVVQVGTVETLTLKFDAAGSILYTVFQTNDSSLAFHGTIVANRTVIPEPSAVALLAISGAALLARRRRRRDDA
jgi:hypothetical protein